MTARAAIDWSAKPEPWCWIGPDMQQAIHTEVARIAAEPSRGPVAPLKGGYGWTCTNPGR